jgi:hypothetical protein
MMGEEPPVDVPSATPSEPRTTTSAYTGSVKDLHATLVSIRNFEIGLFWQRSNYFLALNSGIALGFFNLKDGAYAWIFAVMGFLTSVLWLWVCLGGKYWQTRWEQRLMDFETQHLPGLAFFAADRGRIQSDVERGLNFHPARGLKRWVYKAALHLRPSVSLAMIMLAGLFTAAWMIVVGVFFLR